MTLNDELDANGNLLFGTPTAASNTLFGPRDVQFGLKFIW
jgi:hypothetical protein